MLWGREMRAGVGRSTASGGQWSSGHGGGVAPVGLGRGKRAGQLREVKARLKKGSARADWVCSGGSTAGVSLSEFTRGGGDVLRRGSEERARERGEWVYGVPLLLGRT